MKGKILVLLLVVVVVCLGESVSTQEKRGGGGSLSNLFIKRTGVVRAAARKTPLHRSSNPRSLSARGRWPLSHSTREFRAYCESVLPASEYKRLRSARFRPAAFAKLSRSMLVRLERRAPADLRGYIRRLIRQHRERFTPEPADRKFLDARLSTRSHRPYHPKRGEVADLRKVLYPTDVSKTNPFEDPYRAPGGPNQGVNRRVGAFVPPASLRSPKIGHCDPRVDALCKLSPPAPGGKRFPGDADPDRIRFAPRFRTIARGKRAPPSAASDPYQGTSAVARNAAIVMRSRAALGRGKGLNPNDPRNWLPVDSKNGPQFILRAPMGDPLPGLADQTIRTPRAKPLVTPRDQELDPYATAALVYKPDPRDSSPPRPPRASADRPTHHGPGASHGPGKAPGVLITRSRRQNADLRSPFFSNPDMQGAPAAAARFTLPLADPTRPRGEASVSEVSDGMADPFKLPGDSRIAEPMYLQYPRSQSEAADETNGGFPTGPMSYDHTNAAVPPSDRVHISALPWAPEPRPPMGPVGPPVGMPLPSDEMAFMHDTPTIKASSPFQQIERERANQLFHDQLKEGHLPV